MNIMLEGLLSVNNLVKNKLMFSSAYQAKNTGQKEGRLYIESPYRDATKAAPPSKFEPLTHFLRCYLILRICFCPPC